MVVKVDRRIVVGEAWFSSFLSIRTSVSGSATVKHVLSTFPSILEGCLVFQDIFDLFWTSF